MSEINAQFIEKYIEAKSEIKMKIKYYAFDLHKCSFFIYYLLILNVKNDNLLRSQFSKYVCVCASIPYLMFND